MRSRAMAIHSRLVDRTLTLTRDGELAIEDGFPLRFDVMVLLVAAALRHLRRQEGGARVTALSQALWDITFEGFEESLRDRGVTDIRMAARMRKLLMNATGRRDAYLQAWEMLDRAENIDATGAERVMDGHWPIREAIARNVLNGATIGDSRVDRLLEETRAVDSDLR